MLDQNTDRMWYVIGAVIVGAALIFLMNGAFPTLFANVGATFEDKVSETTEMTDGIAPITRPNLLLGTTQDWHTYSTTKPYITVSLNQPSVYRSFEEMGLKSGDVVTLSGKYVFKDGESFSPRINFSPVPYDTDDERERSRIGEPITGKGSFSYTVVVPENTSYLRVVLQNRNVPQVLTDVSVRQLKLEKGGTATPWVLGQ